MIPVGVDTVGIKAVISEEIYQKMYQSSCLSSRIDQSTGEIEYEFGNKSVYLSWNYKTRVNLSRDYWDYDEKLKVPFMNTGIPHISFEFSLPKVLFGHNLYSVGLDRLYDGQYKVVKGIEDMFDVKLPPLHEMVLFRIDSAVNFVLPDEKHVLAYLRYMKSLEYPKRSQSRTEYFGGLYWGGRRSTLKIYAKGMEFEKHDKSRLLKTEGVIISDLQESADKILRVEVEHKNIIAKRVKEYKDVNPGVSIPCFGGYPRLKHFIDIYDIGDEMEVIMQRLLNGTEGYVIQSEQAVELLRKNYSAKQASTFIAIYYDCAVQGKERARSRYSKTVWYKAMSAFRALNISPLNGDVVKVPNHQLDFPEDFSLSLRNNPYIQLLRSA